MSQTVEHIHETMKKKSYTYFPFLCQIHHHEPLNILTFDSPAFP